MKRITFAGILLVTLWLAACGARAGNGNTPAQDRPARAVEAYLGNKVSGDQEGIRAGLCSEMEAVLERELRTFESVSNASIENMSCAADDPAAENETIVRCTGQIVALYGTEQTTFPLTSYRAVNEDGEWKWCGEGE